MAKSMTSKFTHEPNELISFLTSQCLIDGEPLKINLREQDLLNKIYEFNTGPIRRVTSRRQGNTTLLAAIGLFYALRGVSSVIGTLNHVSLRHTIDMLRDSLHVIPFQMQSTNSTIRLSLGNNTSEYVTFKTHEALMQRTHHKPGIILIDDMSVEDFSKADKIVTMYYTIPIVVNVTP